MGELLTGGTRDATSDAARAEIVKELFLEKNLNRVSELDQKEIVLLSIIKGINAKVESPVVTEYAKQFIELKVSNDRKGRAEVVDIARPRLLEPQTQRPSWRFW